MKNYLNYYYNINVLNLHRNQDVYFFEYNNYNFYFFPYIGDLNILNNIYSISNEVLYRGLYCNKIVKNKDLNIITLIDDTNYVMIMYKKNLNKQISISDIVNFNNLPLVNKMLDCSDWKRLWEEKIDYFEYQLSQFGNKHPLIRESFAYYTGYVELAISLLNEVSNNKINIVLTHKRIKNNSTLYDLYDPFNFVLDNRIRDAVEYFKSKVFEDDILEQIDNYFKSTKLESNEYILFFIRMLYPSFYFDEYEKIINNNLNDDIIKPILNKTNKYEQFIKKLYRYIMNYSKLPNIEWLN